MMLTPNGRFELNVKVRHHVVARSYRACFYNHSSRYALVSRTVCVAMLQLMPTIADDLNRPRRTLATCVGCSYWSVNRLYKWKYWVFILPTILAIIGLQGFFPLKGSAAVGVGSLEAPPSERRRLAKL